MNKQLTPEWLDWIKLNIERGCDMDDIVKIALDAGFGRDEVVAQVGSVQPPDQGSATECLANVSERFVDGVDRFSRRVLLDTNKIYMPNSHKLANELVELYLIDDFLVQEECDRLITLIKSRLRPSEIAAVGDDDSSFRTSSTCHLGTLGDPFIQDIDRRICNMMGIDASYSEVIQGQYYEVGQQFKAHTDFFEADHFEEYAATRGQRTYTFFVYLNDVKAGGETEFPRLGVKIRPKRGRALVWSNLTPLGTPNHSTSHQAHPVVVDSKCVITKWFRAEGRGPMYTKTSNEFVPNFTKIGFEKSRLAPDLYRRIGEFYRKNHQHVRYENADGGLAGREQQCSAPSTVMELPGELRDRLLRSLCDELSGWCGAGLVPTQIDGIRTYSRGAVLGLTRNPVETQAISAIVNIDEEADKPWPLRIEDNYYRIHNILLCPGDVLYHEGARLTHGRPEAFDGDRSAFITCHYRLQSPSWLKSVHTAGDGLGDVVAEPGEQGAGQP